MKKPPYYLSEHAFFCFADNHYVFLDLRADEYLCLGRAHTDAVKDLLNGHQFSAEHSPDTKLGKGHDSVTRMVIQALLQKGLLVENEACGKIPSLPTVDTPLESTMENPDKRRLSIGSQHVWHFFSAAASASANLRWNSIDCIVRKIQERKSANTTDMTTLDNVVITDLFNIFRTLRPYYPRKYLCLFDSLALLHFMARYSVFPQWVYGVKLEPFGAHCWVQARSMVVNDIIDNVRDYTPIMSV